MYGRLFVYFRSDRDHHRHDGICYSNEGGSGREIPKKKLVMCLCKLPLASLGTDCRQRNTYMTRERTKLFVSGRPFSFMFARGDWTWPRYVRALE